MNSLFTLLPMAFLGGNGYDETTGYIFFILLCRSRNFCVASVDVPLLVSYSYVHLKIGFIWWKFFLQIFWRSSVLFVLPLLSLFWTSGDIWPGFQSQGGFPSLYASLPACNGFLKFTSGATPANLLMTSMAAETFESTYLISIKHKTTRMHSNRMHTVRCLLYGEGSLSRGLCPHVTRDKDPLEGTWDQKQRPPKRNNGPGSQTGNDILQRPLPLWTEPLTHACENITLSQTLFADGKLVEEFPSRSFKL